MTVNNRGTDMKRLCLAVLMSGLMLAAGHQLAAAQQITIGVAGPMSGQYASFGEQLKNGAVAAVEDLNKAGGVLGKQLKLEVGDDACDPKQARAVAEKFASLGMPFVAGHYCSSSSIPASDAYAEGNVLQITPASTNPAFTERGLWNTFRICGRDDQQGKVDAEYLIRQYRGKNIALLHDKSTYGKGLADETRAALNKAGIKEKMYEAYGQGQKDFTALVSKLKAAAIDVVFVGGYHTEAGLLVRQMRDQGLKTQLVAGDALADKQFGAIAGPAGEGTRFTFGPDPRVRPEAAAVVKSFKDKGIDPEGYTLYSYATMQVWAQAAAKAGTTDPKKVAAALHDGTWNTVMGPISFDKKGDITKPGFVWYVWKKDGTYAQEM
jgi:branched-chain amino acid transport system substrate-binding protein